MWHIEVPLQSAWLASVYPMTTTKQQLADSAANILTSSPGMTTLVIKRLFIVTCWTTTLL